MYQRYGKKWAGPTVGIPGTSGEFKEKWKADPALEDNFINELADYQKVTGFMPRAEYEELQNQYPELKNISYEDIPKFMNYTNLLKQRAPRSYPGIPGPRVGEIFSTPASRYGWDVMGETAKAGGVSKMARGGLANLTRTVAPDSGPVSRGLSYLYNRARRK